MSKYLYLTALIIGMAAATPAQAGGWFSFGNIMGTGAGETGFGTKQIAGHQNLTKVQKKKHLAAEDKEASFVAPTSKALTKSASSK